MNVTKLLPLPTHFDTFRRNRARVIPEYSGCYALTTYSKQIVYLGLAKNLRRRFCQHLDSDRKTAVTELGKAMFFYWLKAGDTNKLERTWMNMHIQYEGTLPSLNKAYSPVFV